MMTKNHLITLTLAIVSGAMAPLTISAQEQDYNLQRQQDFSNLPEAKRSEYVKLLQKAQSLSSQDRIFDTLEKINEADKIFPDHPISLNLKGVSYMQMRNYDKATSIYQEALAKSPKNSSLRFNLAEIEFVSKNWQEAETQFMNLLESDYELSKTLIHICEFKILLSKLKLGKVEEATKMSEKYDRWDDTPFFYFSKAAIFQYEGKTPEARKLIADCITVWNNPSALHSWADTAKEYELFKNDFSAADAQ